MEPVNGSTFLLHWVHVLGRHIDIFISPVASEVGLYAIPTGDFLYAFTQALGVRYDNVPFGLGFSGRELDTSSVLGAGTITPLTGNL